MAVETPYPTLAVSQFLSQHEIRTPWLSLYAGALARGTSTDDAIAFAQPPWLREREEEPEVSRAPREHHHDVGGEGGA